MIKHMSFWYMYLLHQHAAKAPDWEYVQSHQNLCCPYVQSMAMDEGSGKLVDL